MEPNQRDDERGGPRVDSGSVTRSVIVRREQHARATDLVFDFSGLHSPELTDLALILTARLRAGPSDRVWVRALPYGTWRVLRALGLDHLFHVYPAPGENLN